MWCTGVVVVYRSLVVGIGHWWYWLALWLCSTQVDLYGNLVEAEGKRASNFAASTYRHSRRSVVASWMRRCLMQATQPRGHVVLRLAFSMCRAGERTKATRLSVRCTRCDWRSCEQVQ
jgi:hypothetical protein